MFTGVLWVYWPLWSVGLKSSGILLVWLGQWLLSVRRNVAGWNQRHCSLPVLMLLLVWYDVCWSLLCWSVLWHMWDFFLCVTLITLQGICFVWTVCCACLPFMSWRPWYAIAVLFAGAFERPSFGNGEVPLWSVAVCVSGRFNNSCHRINFYSGENRDCSWLCASFASEFGLSRLAWDGACRKASLYTTQFGVCFGECCNVLSFCGNLSIVILLVHVGRWWILESQRVCFSVACLPMHTT